LEIWNIPSGYSTRWKKIMAKINVRIPEPKEEYQIDNQRQIIRSLTGVIEQLNSTYLKDLKEDQERFTFYMIQDN
jgi:hypothetical protein